MIIKYLDESIDISKLSRGSGEKVLVKCDDCGLEWVSEHRYFIGKS